MAMAQTAQPLQLVAFDASTRRARAVHPQGGFAQVRRADIERPGLQAVVVGPGDALVGACKRGLASDAVATGARSR